MQLGVYYIPLYLPYIPLHIYFPLYIYLIYTLIFPYAYYTPLYSWELLPPNDPT